ncbi:5-oxoprolinase subunit B/C family protein [Pseudokineococcus sp. 1T1Z-3]|uniref:5-oxoprolinase subunit B/C family protein n=1 Tax=Pseudokineococcus sp. 1T1Z-3 TaxID=3132745 RepID=UPI00309A2D98
MAEAEGSAVPVRVLPCGDAAVLVEVALAAGSGGTAPDEAATALAAVLDLAAALRADPPPSTLDVVPAARTVLVRLAATGRTSDLLTAAAHVRRVAASARGAAAARAAPAEVEVDVVYDGPDLSEAAAALGTDPAGLVARHTGRPWTVAFAGFAPGFGYCVQDGPRAEDGPGAEDGEEAGGAGDAVPGGWDVPRRSSPRTAVPAGSVALAGPFSGVYPRRAPGGWQLVGTTSAVLWDEGRDPPALMPPGARVRFRDVGGGPRPTSGARAEAADRGAPAARPHEPTVDGPGGGGAPASPGLEVLATGPAAGVQDLGRPGLAALGVGPSGAADRGAHRLAQRLVGNPEQAAGLEVVLGGLRARARGDLLVALAGAPAPLEVDGRPADVRSPVLVRDGAELVLGPPPSGVRTYLAVRGGLAVAPVLGSRSTDTLAGLGPPVLVPGAVLPVGSAGAQHLPLPATDHAPPSRLHRDGPPVLRVVPGPRAHWFTAAALEALVETTWGVGADADRVGVRLEGPPLARARAGELPSEGVVRGALQVPPSGRPTLLLADHPVTGGYPVVGVVVGEDVDLAAQLRPGDALRLVLLPSPTLG